MGVEEDETERLQNRGQATKNRDARCKMLGSVGLGVVMHMPRLVTQERTRKNKGKCPFGVIHAQGSQSL